MYQYVIMLMVCIVFVIILMVCVVFVIMLMVCVVFVIMIMVCVVSVIMLMVCVLCRPKQRQIASHQKGPKPKLSLRTRAQSPSHLFTTHTLVCWTKAPLHLIVDFSFIHLNHNSFRLSWRCVIPFLPISFAVTFGLFNLYGNSRGRMR